MRAILAAVCVCPLLLGCATPGEQPRPFVIGNGRQVADLWWRGELTDQHGNRWNVSLIPGIGPTFEWGGERWKDGLDFATDPFEGEFWEDRADDIEDGVEFAAEDVLGDFLAEGLARDFEGAGEGISSNLRETPFGWIPRAIGHAVWGFLVKPVGRLALAPVGVAGGLLYSVGSPVVHVAARPVGGLGYCAVGGTALPALRLAAHPPVFMLAMANREPAVHHDGSFGLSIIRGPDQGEGPAWVEETPADPAPPPVRPWADALADEQQEHLWRVETAERTQLEAAIGQRRAAALAPLAAPAGDEAAWRKAWEEWVAKVDPAKVAGGPPSFDELLRRYQERQGCAPDLR